MLLLHGGVRVSRLFDEHQKRNVRLLNGAWRFLKDPDLLGIEQAWSVSLPTEETVTVPSVWNTKEGSLTYEGVAWYEKSFYSEGGTLRICFDAVMTEAYVWLDGELLGTHYGGFSAFDFTVDIHSFSFNRIQFYYSISFGIFLLF